jgi:hypothetical protein
MNDGGPSFAFVFRGRLGQPLYDLAEADVAAGNADFVWVISTFAMPRRKLGYAIAPGHPTSSRR